MTTPRRYVTAASISDYAISLCPLSAFLSQQRVALRSLGYTHIVLERGPRNERTESRRFIFYAVHPVKRSAPCSIA